MDASRTIANTKTAWKSGDYDLLNPDVSLPDGSGMRLFANRYIRRLMVSVTAVLLLYALAVQLLCGHFALSLLLLSLAASGVIVILCIRYFKKQDSILENAANQLTHFLSGQRDACIDCHGP